jgi:hypothetical protein
VAAPGAPQVAGTPGAASQVAAGPVPSVPSPAAQPGVPLQAGVPAQSGVQSQPGHAAPGSAAAPAVGAVPPAVDPGAPTGRRAARAAEQSAAEGADGWTGVRPVVPAPAQPDEPAPARAPHQAQPAPFLVTLDTGQVMTVTGPGLIGRAPRPQPGERCDHVIVVEDPERSVSRTHARFGIENGTFWVSDAGSGNGTTLRLPGGRVIPVPADQRVLVPSGATIQVGDRGVRIDAPGAAGG